MYNKVENFLINVTVLEGRHFAWPSMDSAVVIRVANQKKCTGVRYSTDCPFFNEYYVFEFTSTLEALIDKSITLTVIQPRKIWRKKKILGYVTLDVATVWNQPEHQFYHKWAILTAPTGDPVGGPRGYLKVNINVLNKGETPKLPIEEVAESDEIEGNLMLPDGMTSERQRANYIFKIYRGEDLIKIKSYCSTAPRVSFENNAPNLYVEINFVGIKAKTSVQKSSFNPVWNERLVLTELFPPLCQRVKIELKQAETFSSNTCAVHYINLRSISNDGEQGFLPIFGPTFIHLYMQNMYAGKVLLSVTTEVHQEAISMTKSVTVDQIPPANEDAFLKYENVLLFASIFDVTAINKKFSDKPISFEISFGPVPKQKSHPEGPERHKTSALQALTHDKRNWYLKFTQEKPCLSVISSWPDFRRRMYNTNMIEKIAQKMKISLDEIEDIFENEVYRTSSQRIENALVEMLESLSDGCQKYIDICSNSSPSTDYGNELDRQHLRLCLREISSIGQEAKKIYNSRTKKKSFRKAQKLYDRLILLTEDAQDCWPDVIVTMLHGSKKVAFYQAPARTIAYSVVEESRGQFCGVPQNIFLRTGQKKFQKFFADSNVASKVHIFMWMGLERHKDVCFDSLPPAFSLPSYSTEETTPIPAYLIAEEQHVFNCRVHIYQARIFPGADDSGLCDAFVRVFVDEYCSQTKIQKRTLNPVWDQTLIIQQLTVYGTSEYIKQYPPLVILDVLDQDECSKVEHVGRTEIHPHHVKMATEPYTAPDFPPKLQWYKIYQSKENTGQVLAAIELLEGPLKTGEDDEGEEKDKFQELASIPPDIKPSMVMYRVEIMFWGVRDLKKVHLLPVAKPRITIQLFDSVLHSDVLVHAKKSLNFTHPVKHMDVNLPSQEEFAPPICIKMYDCRSFGRYVYAGIHMIPVQPFLHRPLTVEERNSMLAGIGIKSYDSFNSNEISNIGLITLEQPKDENIIPEPAIEQQLEKRSWRESFSNVFKREKKEGIIAYRNKRRRNSNIETTEDMDVENLDWWTKYYASLEAEEKNEKDNSALALTSKTFRLKVYPSELEAQPEFKNFTDILTSFHIFKGKRTGDETVDEENVTGVFKGAIKIYQWPPVNDLDYVTSTGLNLENGAFQDYPLNQHLRYVVRVYCVKGISLRPKDLNGKSDPYICITMNDKVIKDKENYVPNQVNPIFGRCFEINGVLPADHTITISVWDWDMSTGDDLIGETKIDLENRVFTNHRATCGLPSEYQEIGYCTWRDQQKPSYILESLCKRYNLAQPEYTEYSVRVGFKEFRHPMSGLVANGSGDSNYCKEVQALAALRRWNEIPVVGCHLVSEHVETRSLFHPGKPGVEQGKLQLWLDIFPSTDLPPPQAVNITPRKPLAYEMRAIIWNTQDVILQEDDFFLGEKVSDIYVIGWLTGPDQAQSTDVHYRSLTGEGNFNWRFVFPFEYLSTENKLVMRKKETLFSHDETEMKIPCRLTLQVWDNDTFSADDFLGTLTLDLCRLPKAARTPKTCTLKNLEPSAPTVNLFKIRRTKGWWPFKGKDNETQKEILAGKVEVEFELLTKEEAEKNPVGLGRREPQPLPKPKRPDTSFSWLRNPLKALKYTICKQYRWRIIKCILFLLLVFMILVGVYALPGYSVKRLLGA